MTTRILYFTPNPDDACAFYRGIGPLVRLNQCGITQLPDRISWSTLHGGDIGFMQRPFHHKHLNIADLILDQMPLWVDYDDDLFNVPPDNPSYTTYVAPKAKDVISEIITKASLVTVPTEHLKGIYAHLNDNIQVIPNAYNDYIFPVDLPPEPRSKVVLWRGSDAHRLDLLTHADAIARVAKDHPDWKFMFCGAVPWQLGSKLDVTYIPGQEIFRYMRFIRDSACAAVQIVPLADNLFNHSKSNIAWIEASSTGSVCVVPDWPEWQQPGTLNYGPEAHNANFEEFLRYALVSPDECVALSRRSWDHICSNLLLSSVNTQRQELVGQILS